MALNGQDMSIIESGWYIDDKKFFEMKENRFFKNFTKESVF